MVTPYFRPSLVTFQPCASVAEVAQARQRVRCRPADTRARRGGWCAGPDSLQGVSTRDTDWEGVRLHVVTGKGGAGKTTVAGALALALASGGKRVLLIEVEGRQGIAQVFDRPPLPYEERKIAVAPESATQPGGEVYALVADPESALLEYLEMFYNLRHAGKALTKVGVMDFATTIAPGLRDVLLTGKAAEAVRRKKGGKPVYDAVVLDAPPTGRIGRFLNVTSEVSGLARVGPIRSHADTVQKVIHSPETAVHFVTTLEEMPVQEVLDGVAELRGLPGGGIQVGGIMINMVRPAELPLSQLREVADGSVDEHELAVGLKAAGLDDSLRLAADLAAELTEQAVAAVGQELQRSRLAEPGQPRYDLPMIPDGVDLGGLYRLAASLRDQGAA
jgi:anion-transporting  ArsA/GET3 family ATPase